MAYSAVSNGTLMKNASWMAIERIIVLGTAFFSSVALARFLGPHLFGEYSYLLALVALITPLFSLGMYDVVMRELGEGKQADVIKTCLLARLGFGGLVTVIVMYIAITLGFDNKWVLFCLLSCSSMLAAEVAAKWFQYHQKSAYISLIRSLVVVCFGGAKVVAALNGKGVSYLLYIASLEFLLGNLLIIVAYQKVSKLLFVGQFRFSVFKRVFKQSKYLIFSSLAAVIYLRIDSVMLEYFHGPNEVGLYTVASRLSEVWLVLPQVLVAALYSKMLGMYELDRDRYNRCYAFVGGGAFYYSLVVAAVIVLWGEFFIVWFFGEEFRASADVLVVHVFSLVFVSMRAVLSQWLVSSKNAFLSLNTQLLGALVNVILNMVLIPKYGGLGAAWATVISYCVAMLSAGFFSAEARKMTSLLIASPVIFICELVRCVKQRSLN